jgi:hypothetical protein
LPASRSAPSLGFFASTRHQRRECGRQIVEYVIGKPIERSMEVSGSYEDLGEVLERLQKSPEARRLLSPALFESLQNASSVQSAEQQAHGEKDISDPEQKTPAKN